MEAMKTNVGEQQWTHKVVEAVIYPTVTIDPNAIPFLRLGPVTRQGRGIFAVTTFIQPASTVGKAPAAKDTTIGQVASGSYLADYFCYRHSNQ